MCSTFFFTHYGNVRDMALHNKDWPKVGAKSNWRRDWAQGPLWASLWHPGCWSSIIICGVRFLELFTKSLFYRHWQPDSSIVAIHGIGAHPNDTWCKKLDAEGTEKRYINWLSDPDMLSAVMSRARIMWYGYESQWFGDDAIRQKASTVAQRLLLSLQRRRKV